MKHCLETYARITMSSIEYNCWSEINEVTSSNIYKPEKQLKVMSLLQSLTK